jgi:UDPglucose--hexose-1-phosphate uridylyltransferase
MSELRKDPIIGRWVIISTERGKRPMDFSQPREKQRGGFCPFCPGNEDKTPKEVFAIRGKGSKHSASEWSLRVVPNKFPALKIEGEIERQGVGLYDMMNGLGAHEVIIESPNHDDTLSTLSIPKFKDVIFTFKERMLDLKKDSRFRYSLIFKNHGVQAGASLEHTHSQLIALPIVPKRVIEELKGAHEYYSYKERCIYCDIVRQEIRDQIRVISENSHFLAIAPFAPKFPFETWIIPKEHSAAFEHTSNDLNEPLARIFSEVLRKLDKVLNYSPYNFILHTAPFRGNSTLRENVGDYYHWHFEIMPKLTRVAGFEWGSGFYINPTPPEESAKFLRETSI